MGCGVSSPSRSFTYLCASPLFLHLTESQLQSFARQFSLLDLRPGDAIYRQYDIADKIFIIGEGTIQLQVEQEGMSPNKKCPPKNTSWDKKDTPLAITSSPSRKMNTRASSNLTHTLAPRGAGCVIGLETIGLGGGDHQPNQQPQRTATAVAREPTSVLHISKKKLYKYFEREPELQATILECLGLGMEKQLAELPFLRSVSPSQLSLLASLLRFVPLKAGEILFDDGDLAEEGNSMYIVYKGKVKATSFKEGEEIVLNEIGQGRFFGEIGLMIDIPRTARISAVERCLLLELKKKDFQSFLKIANAPLMNAELDALMKKRTAEHFRKYNVPFFSAIPFDKYAVLANLCSIQQFNPAHVLCYEGERAAAFYIIAHGTVEISIHRRVSITKRRFEPDIKEEMDASQLHGQEHEDDMSKPHRKHSLSISTSECKPRSPHLPPISHRIDIESISRIPPPTGSPIDMDGINLGFDQPSSQHPSPQAIMSLSPVTHLSALSTSQPQSQPTSISLSPQPHTRSRIMTSPANLIRPSTSSILEPIIHTQQQQHHESSSMEIPQQHPSNESIPSSLSQDTRQDEKIMNDEIISPIVQHVIKPISTKWEGIPNTAISHNKHLAHHDKPYEYGQQRFDTRQLTIGSLGPGNFFGEASLLTNEPMKATLTCLSRCVILSISADNLKLFFQSCPEAEANFQVKLARYDISLEHLLYHPVGLQYFMTHCQREYSAENIDFWVAARTYRMARDVKPHIMIDSARAIVREFIASSAVNQVNILGTTRQAIETALAPNEEGRINISPDLFNPAMSEIVRLMASDSFIRFKQSILFQEFLQETTEGDTLRDRGFSISGPVASQTSNEVGASPRHGTSPRPRKMSGKA